MNSKIFITNFCGHDIAKAFEHTDLSPKEAQINITEGNVDIFNIDRLVYTLKEKIRNSTPRDLLLLCGSGVINSIAFSLWFNKHKIVRFLIYNAKSPDKEYILKEVVHQQMYENL